MTSGRGPPPADPPPSTGCRRRGGHPQDLSMRRTLAAAISFALSVTAVDAFAQATATQEGAPSVVNATTQLPRNVRPLNYTVAVVPHADKLAFDGKVAIRVEVL